MENKKKIVDSGAPLGYYRYVEFRNFKLVSFDGRLIFWPVEEFKSTIT